MSDSVIWLTQSEQVEQQSRQWLSLPRLFMDTEFLRERTFFPKLALVQVFDGEQVYFIEPEAAKSTAFISLLQSETIAKVFHSASEDCEVFYRHLGVQLNFLIDTQILASYQGLGQQLSYAAMVEQLTGTQLEKSQVRSDWLQRPLTDEQIGYAAADVTYLQGAYQELSASLQPKHQSLALEDCQAIAQRVQFLDDDQPAYLAVKNAWRLDQRALKRLVILTEWREHEARDSDQPRSFIAPNQVLFELAKKGLQSDGRLPFIKDWHGRSRRHYANKIQLLLSQSVDVIADVKPPLSPQFWQQLTRQMQQVRQAIDHQAATLEIDLDVACSKSLLRGYVKYLLGESPRPPLGWTEWREQQFGPIVRPVFSDSDEMA